jgi:FAD dependent oxidoreductase
VPDSVGMGAYNMDSHNVQRYVNKEGRVLNEGDVQVGSRPYPVSWRSIHPKAAECTNLLVPVCLSASHIAYGSIRMEPVFMVMGQSAATAAALAIDDRLPLQSLDYQKLKTRLLSDGQVLDFESAPAPARKAGADIAKLPGTVVDDAQAECTGFEVESSTASPFAGAGYRHDNNEGKGTQRAIFRAKLPAPGRYEVRLAYTALPNRASNVPVTAGGKNITVNQRTTPPIDGLWLSLGTFENPAEVVISNEGTDGFVIIDAVQWLPVK